MRNFIIFLFIVQPGLIYAQSNGVGSSPTDFSSFISYQKTLERPADAMNRKEFSIKKQFAEKGLQWPAKYVYIRSFKFDSQLEVWVKNDQKDAYKLFKTYKVCALAGTLGPKRMEGDYQVPEGFYYINEFNPKSSYHLSLGLNYPNISDNILSDIEKPGGEIFIHGSCVTVGCIPLTDPMIEELYIISAHAKDLGQDFIPVHIFPVRFNVKKSVDYLDKMAKDDILLKKFSLSMEDAFNYFEKHKQLPVILISEKGEYIINDPPARIEWFKEEIPVVVKKNYPKHIERIITDIPESVTHWPEYPGGGEAFTKYLEKINKEMIDRLPAGIKKAYVQMEFIIDSDGTPVNFKILKGGLSEDFNHELISKIETTMGKWQPARSNEKPVAKKMVQTVAIIKPEPLELLSQ